MRNGAAADQSDGIRNHFLFKNPMTVKRFPELAVQPQEVLAKCFNTEPVPPKRFQSQHGSSSGRLDWRGKHKLEPVQRRGAEGLEKKRPFMPVNPAEARQKFTLHDGSSIFHGSDYDSVHLSNAEARRNHETLVKTLTGGRQFSPVCPSMARTAIECKVYQNSSSLESMQLDKNSTLERSRLQLEKYNEQRIGRAKGGVTRSPNRTL
eukprot:TRINITY_DN30451_c0_g1_i1.p1 TRINITY_DN30451_c0_g1~~TRINITY_DN30451_c0_g1_i1.p1  ORF type:complete len:207 (+),score=74.14 TRINITY_DN30451_c0_g1_i1:57-677(+)